MRAWVVVLALVFFSACAGRHIETAQYDRGELPTWILEEWSNAQEELMRLPGIKQDPRRFSPYDWQWVQLDTTFTHYSYKGGKKRIRGITIYDPPQIIVCCGRRDTVRHEAFHAILKLMGDPRFEQHYPELKETLE